MIFSKVINQKLKYIKNKKEIKKSWMLKFDLEMRHYTYFLETFFSPTTNTSIGNLDLFYVKHSDWALFSRNLLKEAIQDMLEIICI